MSPSVSQSTLYSIHRLGAHRMILLRLALILFNGRNNKYRNHNCVRYSCSCNDSNHTNGCIELLHCNCNAAILKRRAHQHKLIINSLSLTLLLFQFLMPAMPRNVFKSVETCLQRCSHLPSWAIIRKKISSRTTFLVPTDYPDIDRRSVSAAQTRGPSSNPHPIPHLAFRHLPSPAHSPQPTSSLSY